MWMVYGANGYTGTIAAPYSKAHDLSPVAAGRHGERIRPLAERGATAVRGGYTGKARK
jgi:saccharopine dehydrogenase (NAD+, L-lysine-forming)